MSRNGHGAPTRPLWLAAPTRFADLTRHRAGFVIALLALSLLASLSAIPAAAPPAAQAGAPAASGDRDDILLYERIVAGIRAGGSYYPVAAAALRDGDYPLRPFITFRLPTLAIVQSLLPRPLTLALLYGLAAGTVVLWYRRVQPVFTRPPPRLLATALIGAGLVVFVQPDLAVMHEIWAALLVALSLALQRPGSWLPAVTAGLAAMLIRETAVLYAAAMLALALRDGNVRAAAGWGAAIAILGIALVAHAGAVANVVTAGDPASPGWSGLLGPGFFLRAVAATTPLMLLPVWIAAPVIALALFGWSAWRDPLGRAVIATIAAWAVLIALAARADTYYWAMIVAPLIPPGLMFVPDAIRDLAMAMRGGTA